MQEQMKQVIRMPNADTREMPERERQILENAINRLPGEQEEVLNMRIWNGDGIGTIADHLVMDWDEAQEIIEDALANVEYDFIRRKLKIEDYPFLFETLEEAA